MKYKRFIRRYLLPIILVPYYKIFDPRKNKEVISLANKYAEGQEIVADLTRPVRRGHVSLKRYMQAQKAVYFARKHSNYSILIDGKVSYRSNNRPKS